MHRPLAVLALTLLLACPAWAEGPDGEATPAARALEDLDSPLLGARERAVERLVTLLPGSRAGVIRALEGSSWAVKIQLVEVLGRDGSEEAVTALVGQLVRADEAQALRIRGVLVRDAGASARLLAAWRRDPDGFMQGAAGVSGVRRLQELIALLRRAEIEEKFLSRKSKSGSTGNYRGQYDILKGEGLEPGYREYALEVVANIAIDRALRTPGLYRTGIYEFLRTNYVDEWEFRSMALNAVAELCTPDDEEILEHLEQLRIRVAIKRMQLEARYVELVDRHGYSDKVTEDALFEWNDVLGDYLDVVACLYIVLPTRYDTRVREFIRDIENASWPNPQPLYPSSLIAGLQIRCGWYRDAISSYELAMREGGSRAFGYYNQACAYASWSTKAGLSERERERNLDSALMRLDRAAEAGWSDVGWMDEDRDLDPLREHRRSGYDDISKRIKVRYALEDD
ncbi:MAG: HEAT repeat domain-containing protein [Planctomycetota bacterium]|nr:HEAT repeat domain-containing protein [Planctomycetota bacterium]